MATTSTSLTTAWTKVASSGSTVEVQAVGGAVVVTTSASAPAAGSNGHQLDMGERVLWSLQQDLYACSQAQAASVNITDNVQGSGGGGGGGTSSSVAVTNFPATQPVSASALPLPAGAATSALQTTGNTALGTPADTAYADTTGAAAGSLVALFKGAFVQLSTPKNNPGVHPTATPVATALNYTAGKCIGAPLPLANFVRAAGLSSLIQSAVMRAAQEVLTGEIDIILFRGQPTVLAGLADNATFSVAAADTLLVSKVLRFSSWDNLGVGSIASNDSIGKYLSLASGTTAYVQFVARGTIALTAANDLSVSLALIQD